jgi:hypothetical protein
VGSRTVTKERGMDVPSASVDTEKADSIAALPRAFRVVPILL